MTDEQALLRAILDAPEDDAPRLVYADWLDEDGQTERAEFIRVQIELAKLPAGSRKKGRLEAREQELLDEHKEEWVEPLMPFAFTDYTDDPCEFRRGFVESMHLLGEDFVEQAPEIFARTPLRKGVFSDEEEYGALAGCKHLMRLRELDFTLSGLSDNFRPSVLLRSRHLRNIEVLRLCGHDDNCHFDLPGLRALARAKHLGNVRELDLRDNWFGDEGIEVLAGASNFPALRTLAVRGVGVADSGLQALVRSSLMANLTELNLANNDITDVGVESLLRSSLTRLDLRNNEEITRAGKQALRERFGKGVVL